MKIYSLTVNYTDGRQLKFRSMKQMKRVNDTIDLFKKNRLVNSVELRTEELGEHSKAGEYKEYTETVYEKNKAAQALGKLSAQSRDTSSDAMRELARKRWNK